VDVKLVQILDLSYALYLQLIVLSIIDDVRDTLDDGEFINLKINLSSFSDVFIGIWSICVFIGVSDHVCISIYICTVFIKKYVNRHMTRFNCHVDKNACGKHVLYSWNKSMQNLVSPMAMVYE
jgi:hypothetical protein